MSGSLLGVYWHIALDSSLYSDIKSLFLLEANPLLVDDPMIGGCIYALCFVFLIVGLAMYLVPRDVSRHWRWG
jgi:hypothetical protein